MIRILRVAIASCLLSAAAAPLACADGSSLFSPHPAVVRVMAPEADGASFGSGSLVAVTETHGLVVTNWHVVRDAAGPIMVFFPDGFTSGATVLRTDRDWDLAALAIWRPRVAPIPLSNAAPRPGELLSIAGYGSGQYRTAAGRCTEYVSPGGSQPFEMVELETPARNGDSGGPIFNDRGELAGVLFGSAFGRTTGSYCGRVRWFLSSVSDQFRQMPSPAVIAQQRPQPSSSPLPVAAIPATPLPASPAVTPVAVSQPLPVGGGGYSFAPGIAANPSQARPAANPPLVNGVGAKPLVPVAPPPASSLPGADQIKNIFALIGVLAVLFFALRLLGSAVG